MRHRTITLAAILTSTVITLAACGSQVPGLPRAAEIDVRHLDVGSYPVEPFDAHKTYRYGYDSGKDLAAIRLTDHVILGLDIDPKLRYGTGVNALTAGADFPQTLSAAAGAAALRNNFMFGLSYGASDIQMGSQNIPDPNATLLTLQVMQFGSATAAGNAATQMEQVDFGSAPEINRDATIHKYGDAHSYWQSEASTIASTIAHGSYVVGVTIRKPGGNLSTLAELVEKVFTEQFPLLDSLPPLTPLQVLELNPDPDGITRRLLNSDQIWLPDISRLASYDLRGFLHFQQNEEVAEKLYKPLHIDRFGTSGSYPTGLAFYNPHGFGNLYTTATGQAQTGDNLYRSSNEESAHDIWIKILNAPDASMTPRGIPNTKCAELPTIYDVRDFTCAIQYRQYVGIVWGTQLGDAQQRAAAQYALLANSQWM
ncbi:hypothetical protein ABIA39_003694 [Nocardia sp. GAS34]|uniref:DUF7373 family lipoprotein n=1 Tax=unclassified Nocardia TaxID=2637762 RepID=UPI003D246DBA